MFVVQCCVTATFLQWLNTAWKFVWQLSTAPKWNCSKACPCKFKLRFYNRMVDMLLKQVGQLPGKAKLCCHHSRVEGVFNSLRKKVFTGAPLPLLVCTPAVVRGQRIQPRVGAASTTFPPHQDVKTPPRNSCSPHRCTYTHWQLLSPGCILVGLLSPKVRLDKSCDEHGGEGRV